MIRKREGFEMSTCTGYDEGAEMTVLEDGIQQLLATYHHNSMMQCSSIHPLSSLLVSFA